MEPDHEAGSVVTGRVSVVVPTRNVERTLEACLISIKDQDHLDVELVVVDNHSTDATEEIARRYADAFLVAGPERSTQRNVAVAHSSGEFILWIDSDMILPAPTVRLAVQKARDTGAEAVSIPEVSVGPGFWTACRALERTCYLDDPDLYYPRLLTRSLFDRLGGFDESMAGPEDVDLRRRMNASAIRLAHSDAVHILHDEGRLTLRSIMAKRVYYGRSLPAFAAANPDALRTQGASTLKSFARHRRRLARHPLLSLGIATMRSSEAFAYGYGYWRGREDLRRDG